MWLRANKLSLKIEKTELAVFRRQNTKLNNSFKIKLDGKRLFPTSSVKYLSVLLGEHLTGSPQISHILMKLNGAIGLLSKLKYQANIDILKAVYHSLFGTHLMPASYGVKTTKKHKINSKLSKTESTKKIAFKKQYESSAGPLYKNLNPVSGPSLIKQLFVDCFFN